MDNKDIEGFGGKSLSDLLKDIYDSISWDNALTWFFIILISICCWWFIYEMIMLWI